jgi:protease-4
MQDIYGTFKKRVAAGRKLAPDAVEKIAQGRVWTGADAAKRGLVDQIGTLDDARAFAREKAGMTGKAVVDVYPPEPSLVDILGSLGGVRAPLIRQALALTPGLAPAHRQALLQGIDQALPFAEDPIRAVAMVPSLR